MNGYWFTSSLFQIEPGEDAEINPGCYGQQLAIWLKTQLEHRGYSVEPIINEDWGRCLMCSRDPFMLWVGCGNVADPEQSGTAYPGRPVVWHCFVVAELPWSLAPPIGRVSVGSPLRNRQRIARRKRGRRVIERKLWVAVRKTFQLPVPG